jgi:ADP-heptose:LPS heptosyltransferase
MLPPLLFSVRVPTLLAKAWRALLPHQPCSTLPRRGRLRIIIFRLDAMGDVVMTTPFFRELKRNFPNSRCTVTVQHAFRPLLVTNPFLDEILTLPEITADWLPRRAKNLLAALLFYWRSLRTRSFDIAISPRWDVDEHLATLLCLLTNATKRVGYTEKASPRKQQLNRGFDAAFNLCLPAGPVQHEVRRNLAVVEALGGAVHDSRLEVRLTEHDRESAARLLANVAVSTRIIALGIGASSTGRRWPLVCYAEAVSRLARQVRVQPVILCSAGEREQALRLAALLNAYENSICEIVMDEKSLNLLQPQAHRGGIGFSPGRKSLCESYVPSAWVERSGNKSAPQGRISLAQHGADGGMLGKVGNQSEPRRGDTGLIDNRWDCKAIILAGAPLREACAVLERCDLFIGNDSGTAHLAATMECKTIVISRHPRDGDPNHSNSPLRFGPYCRQARVLQPATGLDACTAGCRVTGPHCITAVSVDDVVSAAQAMLGNPPVAEWACLLNGRHERAYL